MHEEEVRANGVNSAQSLNLVLNENANMVATPLKMIFD